MVKNSMVLSFIVPVYNVEAYLKICVDSLLRQDLPSDDYEIILVDDGSTDNSGTICDAYAKSIGRIRVIHQDNRGLSAARNAGVRIANGKYLQFVDSDDFLIPNTIGGLVHLMETKDLDILRFNYQNVDYMGRVFESNKMPKKFVDYSSEIHDGEVFLNERLGTACYAVQFIIRSSLLTQPGNDFKEGIFFEDVEWTPRIILQAKRVTSSDRIVYNYRYREDSITREVKLKKKEKIIQDRFAVIRTLMDSKRKVNDGRWFDGMISQIAISIIQETSQFFYSNRKEYIGELKNMDLFPLSVFHATDSAIRKIRLANLSPYLLCATLHFKRGKNDS